MGWVLLVAMLVALAPSSGRAQVAALISRNGGQQPADSHSYRPSLSADGRFVAFESWAGNLAPGVDVTNNGVFVRDLIAGTTALASPGIDAPPNDKSYMAAISRDGRVIAFWSRASNLVPGDTNGEEDLFTYDRVSAVVTRANVSSAGTPAEPADDGIHIVGDRPALSADGRFVAFDSMAGNLVADDTNGVADVFVRDRQAGMTERISLQSDGTEASLPSGGPAISDDGRFVAFWSQAALTPDDVDGVFDVYVYDRQAAALERIGATTASNPPALSGDGRFVAFESDATDIVPGANGKHHVYVHDRTLAQTTRVSVGAGAIQGDGDSGEPAISGDGRWVAFRSAATNLVPGDANGNDDVFLFDGLLGVTKRISVTAAGVEADGFSRRPSVSADGFFVAFESAATNFGFDDDFGAVDLFLGVREDACPDDPGKLFAGVCGCGTADDDPDRDGVPDCDDACPNDAAKTSPGACGCGTTDADTDADGTPDCHDPPTAAGLKALVQQIVATTKRLTPKAADHDTLAADVRNTAGWLVAAENNASLTTKQRRLLATAAKALGDLADAPRKGIARKRAKALAVLRKLLKTVRRA